MVRTMLAWFASVPEENLEQEISTAFRLFDVGPTLLLSLFSLLSALSLARSVALSLSPQPPPLLPPPHPPRPSSPPLPASRSLSLSLTYLSICLVQHKASKLLALPCMQIEVIKNRLTAAAPWTLRNLHGPLPSWASIFKSNLITCKRDPLFRKVLSSVFLR